MKVGIYVRVSTEEQALEGFSISAQKNRLSAYCVAQDWSIAGFYVDEGISAKNMERPELQRLITDIENELVDCVLVYKLDRLTRSVLDLYTLLETFDKYDCKFKSATEVYDTTSAMGRLFITIVAALAQWERENTGERVRFGLEEKVRQGKYAAQRKPYGYSLDKSNGELTIIPEEASIIKKIYKQYLDGLSAMKISRNLNTSNTPGQMKWNEVAIMRVLKNPLYKGTLRWGKKSGNYFEVENSVPPIVSNELFEKIQSHIEMRATKHPRQATSTYIFSGTMKCPLCGKSMVGKLTTAKTKEGKQKYKYYFCQGRNIGTCNMYSISEMTIEKLILKHFSSFDISTEMNEEIDKVQKKSEQDEDLERERIEIEQELKNITKRRKKWQLAWAEDNLTDEEFSSYMREEKEKEEYLKSKLNNGQAPQKSHSPEEIIDLLSSVESNWNMMTDYEKKTVITKLVKEFVVYRKEGTNKREYEIKSIEFN
jgi:site-specific DNA recombinase